MSIRHTSISLPATLVAFLFASVAALADAASENEAWITRAAIQTETGQQIPAGAFGIVVVERPREATLLQLRGKAGRGDVILRSHETGYCLTFPLRFVAGDFGGDAISAHLAKPVRLVLKSRRVAKALANGHDITSDTYRISEDDHPDADIVIEAGLNEGYGFVFNPGRNILADIFGIETTRIACREL
ncbi:hypothetical protein [Oricola nitratireducens]|uniref:hypothetical protein n=1 Tax=Oricola nitratireducens TaxID=2775868 RepID=UPI0018696A95|nr:hypothetical protein [Oricola nitratireducens]